MADVECPLTELPASQCACRNHRGGQVVEPDRMEVSGPVFQAQFPGRCPACDKPIREGDDIQRVYAEPGQYVHVPGCAQ